MIRDKQSHLSRAQHELGGEPVAREKQEKRGFAGCSYLENR
jgi:hypothetical protein